MKRWVIGAALVGALILVGAPFLRTGDARGPGTNDASGPADPEGALGPLISDEIRQAEDQPDITVNADDLSRRSLVLTDQVSLEDVLAAATAGSSVEDGEEFALEAMIHLGDDQNGQVGPREIATLVAAGEEGTAEYIHNQMGIPESLGLDPARIDVSLRPWVRTEVIAADRIRTALTTFVL